VNASPPASRSLRTLAAAASECRGCELYEHATQTVFGAGSRGASLLLVGEQPGDVEDRRGEPFVGPAGRLLDQALVAAGIDRSAAYVTNAVKHFRWKSTASSKRRLHQKPDASHVTACRPWLVAELAAVRPRGVVALGAVAASSLFGPRFRVTQSRGVELPWPPPDGPFAGSSVPVSFAVATVHPSSVLRGDPAQREELLGGLVSDLKVAARLLG
jgi:DNA polymerase